MRKLIETQGGQSLREQLKAGHQANADSDLAISAEWFPLEEEGWTRLEGSDQGLVTLRQTHHEKG